MGTAEVTAVESDPRPATFGHIVCGVNGSRADAETVRQSALLAGAGGRLDIVCVLDSRGYGANQQASIAPARAETAIEQAQAVAKDLGVVARAFILHASSPCDALNHSAEGADLLVVGSRGGSRVGGILLGSVATESVHRAHLPVLIARPPARPAFLDRIVLATDGSPGSRPAADLTATIARVHRSEVTMLTAGEDGTPAHHKELNDQTALLRAATGVEPGVESRTDSAKTAISEYAEIEQPSLLVIGSSGKLGIRALGSVSEHVAHNVHCSVLVARAPSGMEEGR